MHPLKSRKVMELKIILTLLTFFFSALIPTCSLQTQSHLLLQHDEGAVNAQQKLFLTVPPRKIRFTEKVKESGAAKDLISHNKKISLPSGKQDIEQQKQDMVVGNRGTRQEWMEEEAFTMDYHRVGRRRPIHNKQVPVGP